MGRLTEIFGNVAGQTGRYYYINPKSRKTAKILKQMKALPGEVPEPEWLTRRIKFKNKLKSAKRRSRSIKLMEAYKGLYNCAECIHGLINSCLDHLPDGCEYFSDEVTGRRFKASRT